MFGLNFKELLFASRLLNFVPSSSSLPRPKAGLLIWHIDNLKENNREEGFPGQPGWPENNKHYKVALLGADGSYHLEKGSNPGDVGDVFYEGGVTSLGSSTDVFPNTAAYQNGTIVETGIQIKNIRSDGENMLFDLCFHDVCASDEEDEDEDEPASADSYYTGCELVPGWTDTYDDNCLCEISILGGFCHFEIFKADFRLFLFQGMRNTNQRGAQTRGV